MSNDDPADIITKTYGKSAQKYTNTYFNDFTDVKYIDKFLHQLPPKSKILDIGCGPGQFTKYFFSKGFSATGIDITREMIDIARVKAPDCDFQVMDMRKLEFEDSTFDGIFSAYSILHINSQDIPNALSGFHRALKPKGFLCILVQVGEKDQVVDEPYFQEKNMLFNLFTNSSLDEYLSKVGFSKINLSNFKIQDSESIADDCIFALYQKPN